MHLFWRSLPHHGIEYRNANGDNGQARLKALLKHFDHADRKSLGFIAASVNLKKWQPLAKSLLLKDSGVETMFFGNELVLAKFRKIP